MVNSVITQDVVGGDGAATPPTYSDMIAFFVGWSKEDLLGAWLSSPRAVCDKAGVDMPALDAPGNSDFLGEHAPDLLQGAEGATPTPAEGAEKSAEVECGICCGSCDSHVTVPCGHHFCRECWKE